MITDKPYVYLSNIAQSFESIYFYNLATNLKMLLIHISTNLKTLKGM